MKYSWIYRKFGFSTEFIKRLWPIKREVITFMKIDIGDIEEIEGSIDDLYWSEDKLISWQVTDDAIFLCFKTKKNMHILDYLVKKGFYVPKNYRENYNPIM